MKLKIEIKMDGAAFAETPQHEPARILALVAQVIERGNFGMGVGAFMLLRDSHGHEVGKAEVTR